MLVKHTFHMMILFFQLRYGEPVIRRAVPLALALISVSNPKLQILDTLSKFSHDSDPEVAHNAILALGIVGAGKRQILYLGTEVAHCFSVILDCNFCHPFSEH